MRTWLVLAAVLAVAAAAVADALHGMLRRSSPSFSAPTASARIVPPGAPAAFMGTVYYTDSADGCRLKTLSLPGFNAARPPRFRQCRFSLAPEAESVAPAGSAWSPHGELLAVPHGSDFELVSHASKEAVLLRGGRPAFKPNGTLTFLRAGTLLEWTAECTMGEQGLTLTGVDARCARPVLGERLRSFAWLDDNRLVSVTMGGDLVVLERGRIVARRALPPGGGGNVQASPLGRFFTLWLGGNLAGAFDRRGAQIPFPPVSNVRAVAWSPSERWAMLATDRGSVYLFRPNTGDERLRRLDISARDLAWR